MPLSKARDKERKRLAKIRLESYEVRLENDRPNATPLQPKLPWYAEASDHFGEVKSQYYAKQFFSNLKEGRDARR